MRQPASRCGNCEWAEPTGRPRLSPAAELTASIKKARPASFALSDAKGELVAEADFGEIASKVRWPSLATLCSFRSDKHLWKIASP
jgi:hypothetical protein